MLGAGVCQKWPMQLRHSGSLNAPTTEICNYHWPAGLCAQRENKESGRAEAGRLAKLQIMCVLKLMRTKCCCEWEILQTHIKSYAKLKVCLFFCVYWASTPLQWNNSSVSQIYDAGAEKKNSSRDILIKLLCRKSTLCIWLWERGRAAFVRFELTWQLFMIRRRVSCMHSLHQQQ